MPVAPDSRLFSRLVFFVLRSAGGVLVNGGAAPLLELQFYNGG